MSNFDRLKALNKAVLDDFGESGRTTLGHGNAEEFVGTFERLILKGQYIDGTIVKLLGACKWDVARAWESQSAAAAAAANPEVSTKMQKGHDDEEEQPEQDACGGSEENQFMVAPTTFYDSADILLVIMSFASSQTFFSGACGVNKRWNHVSRKMGVVRKLVRNFSFGLIRSLTCCGAFPIALASAGSRSSDLKRVLNCATNDHRDPTKYDGKNGGHLIPLYGLEMTTRGPGTKNVVGTATLLDPTVPPNVTMRSVKSTYPYSSQEANEETLCISVGRTPTPQSQGRVDLTSVSGVFDYAEGSRTELRYSGDHPEDLVVPVLYVRVLWAQSDTFRCRLVSAMQSGFKSEVGESINQILAPLNSVEYDHQRDDVTTKIRKAWLSFFYSLSPPNILWRSFKAGPTPTATVGMYHDENTASPLLADFDPEGPKLSQEETLAAMNKVPYVRLVSRLHLTDQQRRVFLLLGYSFNKEQMLDGDLCLFNSNGSRSFVLRPTCPKCGKGTLKRDLLTGYYRCSGYMEGRGPGERPRRCSYKTREAPK